MNIVINPVFEIPYITFIAITTLITVTYFYLDVSRSLSTLKRCILLILRIIAIALLIVILLQPSIQEENKTELRKDTIAVALDSSKSMRQKDIQQAARIDVAKSIVLDALAFENNQKEPIEFYEFSQQAKSLLPENIHLVAANGETTYFHSTISQIFAQQNYNLSKLILLTDGHDWENEPPIKTALLARLHHIPIFAIPLGGEGYVRDVSIQSVNVPHYSYVKQKFTMEAFLHVTGCEHEEIVVELKKQGEVVDKKILKTLDKREHTVIFEREEEEVGQFEYQVSVRPISREVDITNNSLTAYCRTIDQPIKVLLLEGQPYWDSTFLQRFLSKNAKVDFYAFIQYSPGKIRRIVSNKDTKIANKFELPSSIDEFCQFDIILLGRSIDEFLSEEQLNLLNDYVQIHGGSVIFTRGNAYSNKFIEKNNLTPIVWDTEGNDKIYLKIGTEAPFKSVFSRDASQQKTLLVSHKAINKKSLSVPWAMAVDNKDNSNSGVIYRVYGRGQVVSIGVEGLWQWAFHDKAEKKDNLFVRFWEHTLLWLAMNSDFMPGKDYNFKMSSNHLFLGEKIYFQYNIRSTSLNNEPLIEIYDANNELQKLSLTANIPGRFSGEFLPNKEGKYTVKVISPQPEEAKFIVYRSQPEEREVFVDRDFLATLCRESGGRVISDKELVNLLQGDNLQQKQRKLRLTPIWDNLWFIYFICVLLACDWFLRRKWGLC